MCERECTNVVYMCVSVCAYVYMSVNVSVYERVYGCAYECVHMCVRESEHEWVHMRMCVCERQSVGLDSRLLRRPFPVSLPTSTPVSASRHGAYKHRESWKWTSSIIPIQRATLLS